MIKSILLIKIVLLISSYCLNAQEAIVFQHIYKAKKDYFIKTLKKNLEYKSLLNHAKKQSLNEYQELKKYYPELNIDNFKAFILLEGYDVEEGTYYGTIVVDTVIYQYSDRKKFSINNEGYTIEKDLSEVKDWNSIVCKGNMVGIIDDLIFIAVYVNRQQNGEWEISKIVAFNNYL